MTDTKTRHRASHRDSDFAGGHRWTFIIAAVFMALVLAMGAVMLANRGKDSHRAQATPTITAPQPTATAAPAAPVYAALTTAPTAVSWAVWNKLVLPISPDGPRSNPPDGPAAGFTDTPSGALLAVTHAFLRMNRGTAAQQKAEINYAAAGPGKAVLLKAVPIAQLAIPGQVVGFRMPAWTAGEALIDLAVRYTDVGTNRTVIQSYELPVKWISGDWRLVLNTQGAAAPVTLPALTGYVQFSGVA
jgi:hypothetical protein